MSQRSIEVKVGILILVALGLLAGFVIVMGGLSLEPTYTVYVDFDNPGGLKPGAPVRISGVKIGRVTAIEFRGSEIDPKTEERPALIRVVTSLEHQYKQSLFEDSRWFVTTQGMLGEMFLAVDPGSPSTPPLQDGAVVQGISPPRLDLLLSEAYELLHRTYVGITENEKKIGETFDGLHQTLQGSARLFARNGEKLDQVIDNVDAFTIQANETLLALRERYVDGPQVTRIFNNVDSATATLDHNLGPLMDDTRTAANSVAELSKAVGSPEQIQRYERITRNLETLTVQAKGVTSDARELMGHVKRGRGTLGALVMDEAVYDDVQELLRDLKHNPWKILWRE